jgi:hypothetical protein
MRSHNGSTDTTHKQSLPPLSFYNTFKGNVQRKKARDAVTRDSFRFYVQIFIIDIKEQMSLFLHCRHKKLSSIGRVSHSAAFYKFTIPISRVSYWVDSSKRNTSELYYLIPVSPYWTTSLRTHKLPYLLSFTFAIVLYRSSKMMIFLI